MPAQRRQTGVTKKALQYTVMNVHHRNNLKKKIETENPVPALFKEFEERTKEIERLRSRIKEELALADMAFKKMKKFGLDGYNTIKVEEEEVDELEDYILSHEPTPRPPTPPCRSNRIKNRPFNEDQLRGQLLHPINTEATPSPVAGPSQPRFIIRPPTPYPPQTIHQPIPGFQLPPTFEPQLINNLPYCDGCQNYGHHILYCPEAELGYPPEE
jgi:hypothetical protein